MNIYSVTLANQPIPANTQSPAFKSNKNLLHREMAVDVMQKVRSSYKHFRADSIVAVIENLQSELDQIIKYQKDSHKKIFDSSNIATVKSKIASLKNLLASKSKEV